MERAMKGLAFAALALTVLAPLLFLGQRLGEGPMKAWMLVGTVLWFVTAPWALKGGSR
jgi:hypothetical protein